MNALDQPPDSQPVADDAWRDLFLGTMEEVGRAIGDLRVVPKHLIRSQDAAP